MLPDHLPSVSIRLGSDYIGKLGEVIQIITIFFHPQYNPAYFKNNLVILKMEKHTYFRRNRSLRRIDFDKKSQSLLTNTKHVVVLGWSTMSVSSIVLVASIKCINFTAKYLELEEISSFLHLSSLIDLAYFVEVSIYLLVS